ncbi:MAG TPA: cation-transporting P-type ATPase, partial [Planctomycetota bacterium]|nr:cation-transporting P-type ATPase [Planctomycetota bacterium]
MTAIAPSPVRAHEVDAVLTGRSRKLADQARLEPNDLLVSLGATRRGLPELEATRRLSDFGPNEVAHEKPPAWWVQLLLAFKHPFNLVLTLLATVSLISDPSDVSGPIIIGVMILLSVSIRFWQEFRSTAAAE